MEIVIAVIGSLSAIFGFVTFLIGRRDKRKAEEKAKVNQDTEQTKMLKEMQELLGILVIDTQSLKLESLVTNHPENVPDIMVSAHRYFVELKGDSWMKKIFTEYLNANQIPHPDYLKDVA